MVFQLAAVCFRFVDASLREDGLLSTSTYRLSHTDAYICIN